MITGISGHMGSGKSTVAQHIAEQSDFREDSFAHSLRLVMSAITSIPIEETYSVEDKNKMIPLLGITRGRFLQDIGMLFRQYRENIWVESVQLRWMANHKDNLLLSDVRFPNEVAFVESNGGSVLRLERDVIDNGDTRDKNHSSETSLDDHPFIHTIYNNGTLSELHEKVDAFCDLVGIEKNNKNK